MPTSLKSRLSHLAKGVDRSFELLSFPASRIHTSFALDRELTWSPFEETALRVDTPGKYPLWPVKLGEPIELIGRVR